MRTDAAVVWFFDTATSSTGGVDVKLPVGVTSIDTVAGAEVACPSLAVKVKESGPE